MIEDALLLFWLEIDRTESLNFFGEVYAARVQLGLDQIRLQNPTGVNAAYPDSAAD